MNHRIRLLAFSAFVFAWPGLFVSEAQQGAPARTTTVELTILHTNDTHGHLLPFSYPAVQPGDANLPKERTDIGGIARRATLVRQIREEAAARKIDVWLVDAGDFSDGTPMSTEYHGEADVEAMNATGYDLATLGNHEFNTSLAQLRKLIGLAKFPIVCSNTIDQSTGKMLVQEYVVKDVGTLRIGVFGLLARETSTYQAAREGVQIAGEIETAKRMVALLRPKVDIVLAISHAGEPLDKLIAGQVPGIDVIVGGHSHSRLAIPDIVRRSEELKPNDVNGTVIVQAGQWGGEVGRLDLLFAKDAQGLWHVDRYLERLLPVTSAIAPDPGVAAVVERYWKPIAARYGEVIGTAEDDFSTRVRWVETGASYTEEAYCNLVADAVRETYLTDFDLENVGGIRAPLVKGPITRADLIAVDPFVNTVMLFKITGRDLKRILAQHRPYVSGLRYRVENRQLIEATIGGRPIEDGHLYSGATNSYFAQSALKEMEVQDTGRQRLDVLIEYVRKKGTLKPVYDGRRVVVAGAAADRPKVPASERPKVRPSDLRPYTLAFFFFASSASTRRSTLPTRVLGSASRNSTLDGTL